MISPSSRNTAASVAARLRQRSRETGEDHQILLTRYGLERLMYRLGRSDSASRFVVKGAMMFLVWNDAPLRVTRDLDLLATRQKQVQWAAFLRRTHAQASADLGFKTVVAEVRDFVLPLLLAAAQSQPFGGNWPKGGPWQK